MLGYFKSVVIPIDYLVDWGLLDKDLTEISKEVTITFVPNICLVVFPVLLLVSSASKIHVLLDADNK